MKINLKKLAIGLIIIFGLYKITSLLIIFSKMNEPAVYKNGSQEIEVQLGDPGDGALHRILLVKSGSQQISQEMFVDTGGYKDANLYKMNENEYIIEGAHDRFQITFSPLAINEVKERKNDIEKNYIGTFTNAKHWTFVDSSKQAYRNLNRNKAK